MPGDRLADHGLKGFCPHVPHNVLGCTTQAVGLPELADRGASSHRHEHQGPEPRLASHVTRRVVEERHEELGHQKAQQRLRRASDGRSHDAQRDEGPLVARRPPEPAHDARCRRLVHRRRRLDVVGFRRTGVRVRDGLGEDDVVLRHGRDARDARAAVVGRRDLRLDERLVRAALGHELVVRAALGHGALVEDADLVRAADRAEAVGYHKRRPRLRGRDAVERLLDDALGLGV